MLEKHFIPLKEFLKNPHIPIPYKKNVIFSYGNWASFVLYTYTWIKQQTKKEREVHRHWLIQNSTGLKDFLMGIALHPFIVFSKELNILLKCFKKWKNSKCVISDLLWDIYNVVDVMHRIKKVKILAQQIR